MSGWCKQICVAAKNRINHQAMGRCELCQKNVGCHAACRYTNSLLDARDSLTQEMVLQWE